jgi:hypothetical protein
MSELRASAEVMEAVSVVRSEIERIWEVAWRFTWDALTNGVNDDFHQTLSSNPVLASLFIEMQNTMYIWKEVGKSVDEIPPVYSVKITKLENLYLKMEAK